jgi:hypothetical protein
VLAVLCRYRVLPTQRAFDLENGVGSQYVLYDEKKNIFNFTIIPLKRRPEEEIILVCYQT